MHPFFVLQPLFQMMSNRTCCRGFETLSSRSGLLSDLLWCCWHSWPLLNNLVYVQTWSNSADERRNKYMIFIKMMFCPEKNISRKIVSTWVIPVEKGWRNKVISFSWKTTAIESHLRDQVPIDFGLIRERANLESGWWKTNEEKDWPTTEKWRKERNRVTEGEGHTLRRRQRVVK